MNKKYIVFTTDDKNQDIIFDVFSSYEKAKEYVDNNTDSNIKITGGDAVLYDKFGVREDTLTKYKPELVNNFFPFNTIEYGTDVRYTSSYDGFLQHTYRFIIETVEK